MAENKQEKRTFKWGDSEYLLDDLLKMHAEQENNYYQFAKDRGQYDDTALAGLRKAITDRINAVKEGKAFEGDGVLDTDKVDNINIQTQKKGLFKKAKYVDQDNTEWAKYYLNKLVGQLKPYQKEAAKETGGWDSAKYGLGAYLTGQGLDAKDVFEKYDGYDANNPDAARGFAQRRALLAQHLPGYQKWLASKGFDFTKNDNEWDDTFSADLDNLIKNFDNIDNNALTATLRKLGAGNYADAFTSDRWDLTKTSAELKEESDKKKADAKAKQKQADYRAAEDYFMNNKRQSEVKYYNPFDYSNFDFNGKEANFMNWYGDLNASEQSKYGTYLGRNNGNWSGAWTNLTNALKSGKEYNDANLGILLQGTYETNPHQFLNVGGNNYLIADSITNDGHGTIYNPTNGAVQTISLSDVAASNAEVNKAYKELLNKHIYNTTGRDYSEREYLYSKEGGELIPKHQLGNSVSYNWETTDQAVQKKADANDKTLKEQKAADRYVNAKNKSTDNPDAGFTTAEMFRLGTIGADITSMFLDPFSGTAVGLGSTATNFALDVAEDGFQWKDVGNAVVSAGFDLLGAIPVIGDALGTGSKIVRNVAKWAPRIAASIATMSGVANSPQILESLGKVADSDPETKMTVQDWRNIAQGIGLVTGITRGVRNKIASENIKKQAKVQDVVEVNVRDANGEVKQLLVDGDAAKRIRDAAGDRVKIEAELNKLEPYKGKFGDGKEFQVDTKGRGKWQNPYSKEGSVDGSRQWRGFRTEGRASVTDVYDFSKVKDYSNKYKNIATRVNKDVAFDASTTAKKQQVEADIKSNSSALKARIDAAVNAKNQANSQIAPTKQRIETLNNKLNGVKEADVKTELAGITTKKSDVAAVNDQIESAQDEINVLQGWLDNYNKLSAKQKKGLVKDKADIDAQMIQAQNKKATAQQQLNTLQTQRQRKAELLRQQRSFDELRRAQSNLRGYERRANTQINTSGLREYNNLMKLLQNTSNTQIGNKLLSFDAAAILKDAGIPATFKEGGSVNRNKINKFLNYAKG